MAWESRCVASDDPRLLRAAPVVQWYLLLPPALVPPAVDTQRRLVDWEPAGAYDSAESCQREREEMIGKVFEVWETLTEDAQRRGQARDPGSAQLWGSRCVAEAELGTK
jgi:hypothetical protein